MWLHYYAGHANCCSRARISGATTDIIKGQFPRPNRMDDKMSPLIHNDMHEMMTFSVTSVIKISTNFSVASFKYFYHCEILKMKTFSMCLSKKRCVRMP